ncbi:MAG: hypothetical protein AAF657_34475, partial [Acidobacteriota bacterium]
MSNRSSLRTSQVMAGAIARDRFSVEPPRASLCGVRAERLTAPLRALHAELADESAGVRGRALFDFAN